MVHIPGPIWIPVTTKQQQQQQQQQHQQQHQHHHHHETLSTIPSTDINAVEFISINELHALREKNQNYRQDTTKSSSIKSSTKQAVKSSAKSSTRSVKRSTKMDEMEDDVLIASTNHHHQLTKKQKNSGDGLKIHSMQKGTHPINTPCQYTPPSIDTLLSTHRLTPFLPINTHPAVSTHPINTHTLSTHTLQ